MEIMALFYITLQFLIYFLFLNQYYHLYLRAFNFSIIGHFKINVWKTFKSISNFETCLCLKPLGKFSGMLNGEKEENNNKILKLIFLQIKP